VSDLHERAARGARYQEILQSGEVTEALDAIEGQYADALLSCFDAAERDNLWRAVQVVRKVKKHLGELAGDGRLASHQIAEMQKLSRS
jgi:hypothetical protein